MYCSTFTVERFEFILKTVTIKYFKFLQSSTLWPTSKLSPRPPTSQWRRLHRARGHVPHFYKWLGTGGHRE